MGPSLSVNSWKDPKHIDKSVLLVAVYVEVFCRTPVRKPSTTFDQFFELWHPPLDG